MFNVAQAHCPLIFDPPPPTVIGKVATEAVKAEHGVAAKGDAV